MASENRRKAAAQTCRENFTKYDYVPDDSGMLQPVYKHKLYLTHKGMMQRCYYERSIRYERYGGRGIRVHKPWHNPAVFIVEILALLGPRPVGRTLDRYPNNDGHYEPGNVRWATKKQQAQNRGPATDDLCEPEPTEFPMSARTEMTYELLGFLDDDPLFILPVGVTGWEIVDLPDGKRPCLCHHDCSTPGACDWDKIEEGSLRLA